MEDTQKELERIQNELMNDDTVSLDDLLADEELNSLLNAPAEPEPEKTEPPVTYQNFANRYGAKAENAEEESRMSRKKKKDDRIIVGLMITASALCLGIIGILAYWLTVFL